MCECVKREDGTWHVDECCAWIMDDFHSGEQAEDFEAWWSIRGRLLDPEASVSWYDKREELCRYAFSAGAKAERKRIYARECMPVDADERRYLTAFHNREVIDRTAEELDANMVFLIRTIIRNTEARIRAQEGRT